MLWDVGSVKQGVNEQLSSIEKNVQETDEGVAASAVAVNALTSTSESKQDILTKNRLFVPGILFHIKRIPLKPVPVSDQNQTLKNQADQNQGGNNQADQSQGVKNQADQNQGVNNKANQSQADPKSAVPNQENQEKVEPAKFRYKVVKGTDSNHSRFSRIVLSGTMLSDHSTPSYLEALVNALQNASEGAASSKKS